MWVWHSWSCYCCCCCCCCLPTTRQKLPNQSPILLLQNDAVLTNRISCYTAASMLTSWLNRRRLRYLLLVLCSPILLPLIFASCPILCAVELCYFMSRRRRNAEGGGSGEEVGLLQRYLEDQLTLVAPPPYGDGDEDDGLREEEGVDVECFDSARALLQ